MMNLLSKSTIFAPVLLGAAVFGTDVAVQTGDVYSTHSVPLTADTHGSFQADTSELTSDLVLCKAEGMMCSGGDTCCDGGNCSLLRCRAAGNIGDSCKTASQCNQGYSCLSLHGRGNVCIPDIHEYLIEARMKTNERVIANMKGRFIDAVQKSAPTIIDNWREWTEQNISDISNQMCSKIDAYTTSTIKTMGSAEQVQNGILRFGVEGDAGLSSVSGSVGAGLLYDPKTKQFGCYSKLCSGAMAGSGGSIAETVIGMEFVDSIEDVERYTHIFSMSVPSARTYTNAYLVSREEPLKAAIEIKDGRMGRIGGHTFECITHTTFYEKSPPSTSTIVDNAKDISAE